MAGNSGAWTVMVVREEYGFREPDESPKAQFQQAPVVFSGGSAEQTHEDTSWMDFSVFIHGCLVTPPEGLGLPSLRTGDVVSPFRNGVQQTSDWYEPRSVLLTVEVTADSCTKCSDAAFGLRGKVRRISQALSRFAPGADNRGDLQNDNFWMLVFPDCHDPELICTDDQAWSGPYALYGRPRIVGTAWHRSNENRATMLIRFDAMDHRLIMPCLDTETDPDTFFPWRYSQCVDALSPGSGAFRVNHAPDPTQRNTPWNGQDEVATITRPDTPSMAVGPHGQGYAQFEIVTPATQSPFYFEQSGSGTSGIPVEPGQFWTLSAYWWASALVGTQRLGVNFFESDGSFLTSAVAGDSVIPIPAAQAWHRSWGPLEVPADAAFMQPYPVWAGGSDYTAGFIGRTADVLVERDFNATTLAEVAPPHWYFNGDYYGEWSGTADASASLTNFQRRNLAIVPRGTDDSGWISFGTGGTFTENELTGITDVNAPRVVEGTPEITTAIRYTCTAVSSGDPVFANAATQSRQGAYHPEPVTGFRAQGMISMRVDQPGLSIEVLGFDITDDNNAVSNAVIGPFAMTPGVWQHVQVHFSGDAHAVGFGIGARVSGPYTVGANFDFTATYIEAEEFYEQDGLLRDWFDVETPVAEAATELGDLGGAGIAWTLSSDAPSGMTVLGTQCVWPTISLRGPLSAGLEILFRFDGQEFGYRVLRDFDTFDGASIFTRDGVLGVGSDWDFNSDLEFIGSPFPVGPGPVDFSIIPTGPDDTGTVSICWENSVVGA